MAYAGGLKVDTSAENYGIVILKDSPPDWLQACRKPMVIASNDVWYPEFDAERAAHRDNRAKFRGSTTNQGAPAEMNFEYTKRSFTCVPYRGMIKKSQQMIRNYEIMKLRWKLNLMRAGITQMSLNTNLDFLDMIQNETTWATVTPTAAAFVWTDLTNADPEKDLRARISAIEVASYGKSPNTMIMNDLSRNYMMMHTKIKARFDNVISSPEQKEKFFLNMLGIDNLVVVKTVTNTAKEGQTPSPSRYMGNKIWIGHVDPNPTPDNPTAFAAVVPSSMMGKLKNDFGVKVWSKSTGDSSKFDDGSDGYRGTMELFVTIKQTASFMGGILTTVY